jgi:hypothetical protein
MALNSIDSVFSESPTVRESWSKYFSALSDPNLNCPPGFAIREEKRRDLMITIVKFLGLQNKITTSDLLRTYTPNIVTEADYLATWERIKLREDLRDYFIKNNIGFPDFQAITYPVVPPPSQPPPPSSKES